MTTKTENNLPVHEGESTPQEAAREAGLRYTTDRQPGLHRKRSGKSFRYVDDAGKVVRDGVTLTRIRSLVIPPAWNDVWISAHANGHLQATGRDARGRKQSRYHPHWREARDGNKYEHMVRFAAVLPKIRRRIRKDLALDGMPRQRVLATVVSLMERTHIRVGNEEYAKTNHSYGLTTMRNRHVQVKGTTITFRFLGKSRVQHTVSLHDARLAKIIRRCEEMPGQELFQYEDAEGAPHTIDSVAVNAYLHEITGEHFTAKDFRTWAGSVMAAESLRAIGPFDTPTQAKRNVVQAIASVAAELGNTPSVCRKCYVHPAVLDAYLESAVKDSAEQTLDRAIAKHNRALRAEEGALLALLQQRAALTAGKMKMKGGGAGRDRTGA